jgi:hypothetical protein
MPREYAYNYAPKSQLMRSAPQSRVLSQIYIQLGSLSVSDVKWSSVLSGMWLQHVSQHYLAKYFYVFYICLQLTVKAIC